MKYLLAIDLGAESGRAFLGKLENEKVEFKEIHRFQNRTYRIRDGLHWNIYNLYDEILNAIQICYEKEKIIPDSVGIDTWGVDYGLINKAGYLIGLPYSYRDPRTNNIVEDLSKIIPKQKLYEHTGIQIMQLNTIFQLYAEKKNHPELFNEVEKLLFIPDLLYYFLTGEKITEFSFATTSQLFNPRKFNWEEEIFKTVDIPVEIMNKVIDSGSIIGEIPSSLLIDKTIDKKILAVAVATHDTGSAIAAIPGKGNDWAYISSGTWSLVGIESKTPIINELSYKYNFTNEGGVERTYRFLKNVVGLWLLQECKRKWKQYSYPELVEMAKNASFLVSFIDPDASDFFNPEDMPEAIVSFCRKTGQTIPSSYGDIVQIILQSLALKYRFVIDSIEKITGVKIEKIYITGGGINNTLLNQYVANATGREIIITTSEGSSLGNIMVQAMALGEVKFLSEIRKIIKNSIEMKIYEPKNASQWQEAYIKFEKLLREYHNE
ncbi:MAG: rhamnulokinase [Candidatus Marinimicrobia bacterium]|nr:rhamnulokinase [Candidatus Neomarinimicrobiota bacterium]